MVQSEIARIELLKPQSRPSQATRKRIFQETLDFLENWKAENPTECAVCCELSPFDNTIATHKPTFDDYMQIIHDVDRHTCQAIEEEQFSSRVVNSAIVSDEIVIAANNIFVCYMDGYGVEPDIDAALQWLLIAGKRGAIIRGELFGLFNQLGRSIPADLPLVKWAMEDVVTRDSIGAAKALREVHPEFLHISQEVRLRLFNGTDLSIETYLGFNYIEDATSEATAAIFESITDGLGPDGFPPGGLEEGQAWALSSLHSFSSCWQQPVELCQRLVHAYPNLLELGTSDAETPLLLACRAGRLRSAAALIELGADVNTRAGEGGETPLHWLAINPDAEPVVEALLRKGADINAINKKLRVYPWLPGRMSMANCTHYWYIGTPLQWAVLHENESAVKLLLRRGAQADLANNLQHTPCQLAAALRNPRLLDILLSSLEYISSSAVCDIFRELWFDSTNYRRALLGFSLDDEIETLNTILRHMPQNLTTKETEDTFRHIVQNGVSASSLPFLSRVLDGLDFCLQVSSDDADAATPGLPLARPTWNNNFFPLLLNAVWRNDPDILELVLRKGVDIEQEDILNYSCLHILARSNGSVDCLKVLLRHGASLERKNDSGYFPIQVAVFSGNTDLAQAMVDEISAEQFDNMLGESSCIPRDKMQIPGRDSTFLGHLITLRGLHDMSTRGVNWLLDILGRESSFVACRKNKETVLHLAVDEFDDNRSIWRDKWSLPVLKLLLMKFSSKRELNAQTEEGLTALHIAVWFGKAEEVRLIIKAGAEVNIPSRRFGTALDIAFANPPNCYVLRQREGNLTRDQVVQYVNGRNDSARYLRAAGAKSLQEIENGVEFADWIPFPFGATGEYPTHRVISRPPWLKRYGNVALMPRWSVPSFLRKELKAKDLIVPTLREDFGK
jgi:ankyrin repeat protein